MSERATPEPFTREDATAWAHACHRLSLRWGHPSIAPLLHLTMDVNWTDALHMWVYTSQSERAGRQRGEAQIFARCALNQLRAFGMSGARVRYSDYLYRMLCDERKIQS